METRAVDAGGGPPEPQRAGSAGDRRPRKPGRFQIGVRGLIAAVACFGLIAWAGRSIWEDQRPAIRAARGLGASNPDDRMRALGALAVVATEDPDGVVPALISALGDPDVDVRFTAAVALGPVGRELINKKGAGDRVRDEVRGLIGSLKDREPRVRAAAAGALSTTVGTRSAAVVIEIKGVIDALAAAIGDPDDDARMAAIKAMASCASGATKSPPTAPIAVVSLRPPAALIAAMRDRSAKHRSEAIEALARFSCPLDPWLATLLDLAEHDPEAREACQWAFSRQRPPVFSAEAIPALVSALGSRSLIVRSFAARGLMPHSGDPRATFAIPALLAIVREPMDPELLRPYEPGRPSARNGEDPSVLAANLLGGVAPRTTRAGEVVAALTEVVRSGHESRKASAARALGAFGPAAEPAVPALIRALRDVLAGTEGGRSFWYGGEVARALGRIAPGTKSADEALPALIEALDPGRKVDLDMRLAVIETLPAYGARAARALPRLRGLRTDQDRRLKAAVEASVAAIEGAVGEVKDGNSSR